MILNPVFSAMEATAPPLAGSTDLPGWSLVFYDNFATQVAEGSMFNSLGVGQGSYSNWKTYPPNYLTTAGQQSGSTAGDHYATSNMSVIPAVSGADGNVLQMRLYRSTTDGKVWACAPYPLLPGNPFSNGQLYGRYEIRWKAQAVPGWHMAWLTWNTRNDIQPHSDPNYLAWPACGEYDIVEEDLTGTVGAFLHNYNGTSGGDQVGLSSTSPVTAWHTSVFEWRSDGVKVFLDGVQLGSTVTSRIVTDPMRLVLQTENATGSTQPGTPGTAYVWVDKISIWAAV